MSGDSIGFEDQVGGYSNEAAQVLKGLMGRDPELWKGAHIKSLAYANSERTIRSQGQEKRILGTTASGARVQATDINFTRFQTETEVIPYGHNQYFDNKVERLSDMTKGVDIVVMVGEGEKKRRISLFVPDSPSASGVQRTHQIDIETPSAHQVVRPENSEEFAKALAELEYYLGDDIVWDEKSPSEVEEPFV